MSVTPIRDQVLIKLKKTETKSTGGLYIPDAAADSPNQGIVISTGKGRVSKNGVTIPLIVTEGDTVMYQQGSGENVKVNNEDYLILVEDQILAIID